MKRENISSASHGAGQLCFHLVWKPKYAYKMLKQDRYKRLCAQILRRIARKHKIEILDLAIADDHLHLVIRVPPYISASKALQLLKGGSAYELFRAQPKFRLRYPKNSFWSRGKSYWTVGDADLPTVRNYVQAQQTISQWF